jgi:hypothetical protein
VLDANDPPILTGSQTFSIYEGLPVNSLVHTLVAYDEDKNDTVTFSIVSSNRHNGSRIFWLDAHLGFVYVASVILYATWPVDIITTIQLTDDNTCGYPAGIVASTLWNITARVRVLLVRLNSTGQYDMTDCVRNNPGD